MSILINIASEFTGKKAFKQAETATLNLEKRAKSLGKSVGLALSASAVAAYGKASVKAFAADEAAARRLATAVDNLGLSYYKADVEDFIAKTEKSAGILDDKLRPAFQALLTTTGSLTRSQTLLNNAITISRANGEDLSVVAQDLANGYVGITKGLKKYNTGLTQAELKTKSFSEVLGILLSRSAGAADSYLGTTAYKLDVLSVASANAQEIVGKGLVDAFAKLGGGSSAEDAANNITAIASGIASITTAAGAAVGAVVKLYKALDFITSFGGITGSNGKIAEQVAMSKAAEAKRLAILSHSGRSSSPAGSWAKTKQQRDAEAAAAKRAAELKKLQEAQVRAQKALTAEQKKQAALKKAGSIFDLEQINLIAALKKNLSEEDRKRAELQLALATDNVTEAQKLTYEIAKAQGLGEQMARNLASLPAAKNPFEAWAAFLDGIEAKVQRIAAAANGGGGSGAVSTPATNVPASDFSGFAMPSTQPSTSGSAGQFGSSTPWANAAANFTIQIDGKTIASALLDQSLSGNQAYVNRRTGGFE